MKLNNIILFIFLLGCINKSYGQKYTQLIEAHRTNYKKEFLQDDHSPLKKQDLKYLRFFKPDIAYRVIANFTSIHDTVGFDMQTHSGKIKKYFVYGSLSFKMQDKTFTLFIYYSKELAQKEGLEDYLFLPFTDVTNSVSTFGGGRYLDFKIKDIQNNTLVIDFNKCYNPYCAYADGYSCPIPPTENDISIKIEAGEKMFAKPMQISSH